MTDQTEIESNPSAVARIYNMTPNAIDKHIGEALKVERKKAKMSAQKLADGVGVSRQTIVNYEEGRTCIKAATLYRMTYKLGLPSPARLFPKVNATYDVDAYDRIQTVDRVMNMRYGREVVELFAKLPNPQAEKAVVSAVRSIVETLTNV